MAKYKSEEEKVIEVGKQPDILTVFRDIPTALISAEIDGSTRDKLNEFTEIKKYYNIYQNGNTFTVEGSNGDYIPANLVFKMASSLIDKEVRFLFAESPDIVIEPKGDVGKVSDEAKDNLTTLNDMVTSILSENKFESALLKAAKDCFIGKRIAAMVNFNEEDGVTITFIPSTQFLWETKLGNSNILTKFVAFIVIRDSIDSKSKRIFKKKFERKGDVIYLEEILYDGAGKELEVVTKYQKCDIPFIPAVIITNDGLTGDEDGESEIRLIQDYESWFSKLANADIDAERKSMNPIRYVVDMNPNSTKGLSTSPGALWDLGSDQNTDKQKTMVGMLEPNMSYSVPLKTTLDRIKTVGYEQIDVPNITLETMVGSITSGKALKAIYWPLIVRCKEKMKVWGPALQNIVNIIIQGAYTFPNTVKKYINDPLVPVAYEVNVVQNIPLQEDEIEEKSIDLSEVAAGTMSRKAYMKKWRGLTDDEVQEELEQMALEKQYIDEVAMPMPNQQDQQESTEEVDTEEPIEDEPIEDIDAVEEDE